MSRKRLEIDVLNYISSEDEADIYIACNGTTFILLEKYSLLSYTQPELLQKQGLRISFVGVPVHVDEESEAGVLVLNPSGLHLNIGDYIVD